MFHRFKAFIKIFMLLLVSYGFLITETNAGEAYVRFLASKSRAEGYSQTPAGGNPDTSSPSRPTLRELGVDRSTRYDFETGWRLEKYTPYFGSNTGNISGNANLDSTLISRAVTFEEGARVHSRQSFDWYRVGLSRRYDRPRSSCHLVPKLEAVILDFNYDLKSASPALLHVQRSYQKVAPRLGLDVDSNFTENLSLHFDAAFSLFSFVPNPLTLTTVNASLQWALLHGTQGTLSLILGGGFLRIASDDLDKQELPNRLLFEQSPVFFLGAEWDF